MVAEKFRVEKITLLHFVCIETVDDGRRGYGHNESNFRKMVPARKAPASVRNV